jgi:hypothetical protein
MLLERANQHYGVALPFKTPVDSTDKEFVVQYEVKMDEPLSCGGAYIKLLEETATANLEEFDNNTPYIVMFGPDKCGATNKVRHDCCALESMQTPISRGRMRFPTSLGTFPCCMYWGRPLPRS